MVPKKQTTNIHLPYRLSSARDTEPTGGLKSQGGILNLRTPIHTSIQCLLKLVPGQPLEKTGPRCYQHLPGSEDVLGDRIFSNSYHPVNPS